MIPMLDLKREYGYLKDRIDAALERVLTHQCWIMGPEVKELETRIAEFIGTEHAIGVASGTDALVLALRALALKRKRAEHWSPEDEIITTPFTFTATGDSILRAGATPVFVDIDPETFNIDPALVRAAVNEHTVGVIPVHLYGQACRMDEICLLARQHRLFVVEDVAQAFGASYEGVKCGAWGDAGAFSFFPSKNLGSFGDGGVVTTHDAELAALVEQLRKHGGKDKYNVEVLGYNSRLDTLQAAIVLAKLDCIDEFNKRRQQIAGQYSRELSGLVKVPASPQDGNHVFHQYTVRVRRENGLGRDAVAGRLKQEGVSSMVYYPVPLHRMKVFRDRQLVAGRLEESERATAEVLSLPIGPTLTDVEVGRVVAAVRSAASEVRSQTSEIGYQRPEHAD